MCRSCLLDEKTQEGKRQLERRAKRAEKIQTVRPGDEIPEDLRQHMGQCDNCKQRYVTHISKEGIPVCGECFKIDSIPVTDDNDPIYGMCQGCDTRFSKKYLQHTYWGIMCDLCLRGEDNPAMLPPAKTKLEREEGLRQAVHARACKEAAHDCEYSQQFVHWIIADCSLEQLRDMDMVDTYEDIRASYDDACWVVEYLLNEGRHEELDVCPMSSELWTEVLSQKED